MPLCCLRDRVEIVPSLRAIRKTYISRPFVSNVSKQVYFIFHTNNFYFQQIIEAQE